MMTRRIVRTIVQFAAFAAFAFFVIFLLDRNFRVLPKSIHEHMPLHHHGLIITDIRITTCSSVNPFTSCSLDEAKWHRIEKDLYLGKSMFSKAYVHVARKKEEELTADDKVVMDVKVTKLDPTTGVKGEADERWESRPGGMWIKRSSKRKASDSKKAVTAVDVLFGNDAVEARAGWQILENQLAIDTPKDHPALLTIRRGSHQEPTKPQPRIDNNGKFKILQVSDLHLSTGVGVCREAIPDSFAGGKCEADPRTLHFIRKITDEEKPNLVVLSGDQVNGETAPDAQSAIFKFAQVFIERHIPYVVIFGNHDDEGSLGRSTQMELIETLPYSLSKAGPDDVPGIGNYIVEVLARKGSDHSALTLYLLDTHSYSPDERKFKGYDWIKEEQISWFKKTSAGLKKKHKEYTHIHMDIAFIHIPLPEYRDEGMPMKGEMKEGITAPVFNSGFRDALVEQGVVMVSCGHDHANDYCALSTKEEEERPGLWMCYAGGSGFGGYGGYGGYHRRVRVFDIDMNEARITTWKRLEYGEVEKRIDEQIIVDAGRPVIPPPEEVV